MARRRPCTWPTATRASGRPGTQQREEMTVTQVAADFTYDVDAEWESLPAGIQHKDVSAVGVDSRDQVYLLTRYDSNVLVYDRDGSFITAWGREVFTNPHGLT